MYHACDVSNVATRFLSTYAIIFERIDFLVGWATSILLISETFYSSLIILAQTAEKNTGCGASMGNS